jgi:hypothetical protein
MEKSRYIKAAFIILFILLTLNIGSRIFFNPSEVIAAGKTQYKVVSGETVNNAQEYENLLNKMADQGWIVNHVVEMPQFIVFSK